MEQTQEIVGDIRCPGVDVDRWKLANRCPLFPGVRNQWILARLNTDDADKNAVTEELYDAFEQWFDSGLDIIAALEDRARVGTADNIEVQEIGPKSTLAKVVIAKKREALPQPPQLGSGLVQFVRASFDYRGQSPDMPWPVFTSGLQSGWCPTEANWILLATLKETLTSPPERGDGDVLGKLGEKITDKLESIQAPITIATIAAAIIGGVYLLKKAKE